MGESPDPAEHHRSASMDFELSDEQEPFRKVVRDFAAQRDRAARRGLGPRPHVPGRHRPGHGRARACSACPFPEEYGGGGGDLTTLCVAIEELGRVDQSMAITLEAGVGLGANPIFRFGTEEQRQRWLPDLCAGRALGGFGLTEPEAGSDAGGTRTRAVLDEARGGVGDQRREGVHHQLRHRRSRRSSPSPPAPTPPDRGRPEISTIIVPAGHAGLRGAAAVPEDGLARVGHPRPHLHGLPRARGQPARRAAGAASPTSSPSSTTAASPSPRSRSASSRPASSTRCALRQGAQRVRQADRQLTRPSRSSAPTWR